MFYIQNQLSVRYLYGDLIVLTQLPEKRSHIPISAPALYITRLCLHRSRPDGASLASK